MFNMIQPIDHILNKMLDVPHSHLLTNTIGQYRVDNHSYATTWANHYDGPISKVMFFSFARGHVETIVSRANV